MAQISDVHVEIMKHHLVGDTDAYIRGLGALPVGEEQRLYSVLVAAATYKAVNDRFAATGTPADIVAYVADVRASDDGVADTIDALIAERLIMASLGKGSLGDVSDEQVVTTQSVLVAALVGDRAFDAEELDWFLRETRALADQWAS